MQAAALPVIAVSSSSSVAPDAAATTLGMGKPQGAQAGGPADAFAQALAALMGMVTTTPIVPATTANAGQAQDSQPIQLAANPAFAIMALSAAAPADALADGAPAPATTPVVPTTTETSQAAESQPIALDSSPALIAGAPADAAPAEAAPETTLVVPPTADLARAPGGQPAKLAFNSAFLAPAPWSTPPAAALANPAPPPPQASVTGPMGDTIQPPPSPQAGLFNAPIPTAAATPSPAVGNPADVASASPAASVASTPIAFSALSFSLKLADDAQPAANPPIALAPIALTAVGAPPTPQTPAADGSALAGAPALTISADAAAMALQPAAATTLKPSTSAALAIKPVKSDSLSAPAANAVQSTGSADKPFIVPAPPAAPGGPGDNAARDPKTGSGAPSQTADVAALPNGADASNPNAQATPGTLPQAPIQAAAASLAAANGQAIVSQIVTQTAKSFDGKSTRFDIGLDPVGLGHVDVKIQIDAQGQVTAQMSFDNPHAAAEAQSRAADLHRALEQSGFNLAQGGLSFDVGGQGSAPQRQDTGASQTAQSPTVPLATETADVSAPSTQPRAASGLDIRI